MFKMSEKYSINGDFLKVTIYNIVQEKLVQ